MAKRTAIMRQRHEIDASGITFGRIATRAATLLRGKQKPTYAPNIDAGDYVHITHLDAVQFTGRKWLGDGKEYRRHSGYPGGLHSATLRERWGRDPVQVLRDAVRGMLPPNRLRRHMLQRLTAER